MLHCYLQSNDSHQITGAEINCTFSLLYVVENMYGIYNITFSNKVLEYST